MPRLRIISGPNTGTIHDIELTKSPDITNKQDSLIIGRDQNIEIPLADNGASRRHAEVFRIGDKYFLQDLSSKNGVFVNEQEINLEILNFGDRIRIGQSELIYEEITAANNQTGANAAGSTMVIDLKTLRESHKSAGDKAVESERLQILYRTGKIIGEERNRRKLIQRLLQIAIEAVDAEESHLLTRVPGGKLKVLESIIEKGKALHVSGAVTGRVMEFGKAVLSSDASQDERFSRSKTVAGSQLRSVICAPLIAAGKVSGVIYLSSSKVKEGFSPENLEIVALIAIQMGLALQNMKSSESQRELYFRTIRALSSAIAMRDPSTLGHSERVSKYVGAICNELDLTVEQRGRFQIAGVLHNVGKIGATDSEIEATAGEDRTARMAQIRLAEKVIKEIGGLDFVLPGIRHTYEHFAGTGLPDGLKGKNIPLMARVVSVANYFDKFTAMTNSNAQPMMIKDAIEKLHEMEGTILDPDIVNTLEIAHKKGKLFEA